ncbi:MAG TPA: helix-turn-helix domain-containing protein [Candidatus Dormibacteraeota bacterium]|nr:helix-turn-helix domain-containing protein [Candidatus Dormibacteraeota bacterium]
MAKALHERSRRSYSSPARQAQASATRQTIVRSARKVFIEFGYGASTIESIAAAANVSVPTVYAVFGSKPRVLAAVVADAGSDSDIRELADRALSKRDPRRRLAAAAHVVRTIMERERSILDLLREAGTGSADLVAASRQVHEQQRRALERVVRPLHEGAELRSGLGLDEAVAAFAALASPECYRQLVEELGWSGLRWERWLGDSAARLLL